MCAVTGDRPRNGEFDDFIGDLEAAEDSNIPDAAKDQLEEAQAQLDALKTDAD